VIGIISNLNAKQNRHGVFHRRRFQQYLGSDLHIEETRRPEDISNALSRLFDRGVDLFCINGGDGTLHHVLTEMINRFGEAYPFPLLFPLSGGTINCIANNIVPSDDPESLLAGLAQYQKRARDGIFIEELKIGTLKVEAGNLGKPHYGFIFSNGTPFRVLEHAYAAGSELSFSYHFSNATQILTSSFFGSGEKRNHFFRPLDIDLTIDGAKYYEKKVQICTASTLPKLVLWFSPFYGATGPLTDKFYFLVTHLEIGDMIRHFWPLCRGTYRGPRMFNDQVKTVEMVSNEGYTLDGDNYGLKGRVHIQLSMGPTLRFLKLPKISINHLISKSFFLGLPLAS